MSLGWLLLVQVAFTFWLRNIWLQKPVLAQTQEGPTLALPRTEEPGIASFQAVSQAPIRPLPSCARVASLWCTALSGIANLGQVERGCNRWYGQHLPAHPYIQRGSERRQCQGVRNVVQNVGRRSATARIENWADALGMLPPTSTLPIRRDRDPSIRYHRRGAETPRKIRSISSPRARLSRRANPKEPETRESPRNAPLRLHPSGTDAEGAESAEKL
jgi:hypothetical protein